MIYYGYDSNNGKLSASYPSIAQYSLHGSLSYFTSDSNVNINLGDRINRNTAYGYDNSFSAEGSYRYKKGMRLFARVASGYLAPSIFQLYNTGLGNGLLGPERSITYQVGMEQTNNVIKQKILLFYRNIDDMTDYNYNSGVYANYEKLRTWGVEYEIRVRLGNHFSLNGNYTFVAGRETTISRQDYTDTITYPYLIRRPKHIVNAGLGYEGKRIMANITGRYVGNYYDVGFGTNDYPMKHFLVVNASFSYSLTRDIRFFFSLENIGGTNFNDTRGFDSQPFSAVFGLRFLKQ